MEKKKKGKELHVGSKTFMAFGGGVRLCVGADFAKLVMAIFLHYFVTKYRYLHKIDCIWLSFLYQLIIWLLLSDFIYKKKKGKYKYQFLDFFKINYLINKVR
jgi:hypothetical protein